MADLQRQQQAAAGIYSCFEHTRQLLATLRRRQTDLGGNAAPKTGTPVRSRPRPGPGDGYDPQSLLRLIDDMRVELTALQQQQEAYVAASQERANWLRQALDEATELTKRARTAESRSQQQQTHLAREFSDAKNYIHQLEQQVVVLQRATQDHQNTLTASLTKKEAAGVAAELAAELEAAEARLEGVADAQRQLWAAVTTLYEVCRMRPAREVTDMDGPLQNAVRSLKDVTPHLERLADRAAAAEALQQQLAHKDVSDCPSYAGSASQSSSIGFGTLFSSIVCFVHLTGLEMGWGFRGRTDSRSRHFDGWRNS